MTTGLPAERPRASPGLHPVTGDGVVSRQGELILLCSADDRTNSAVVDELLTAHAEVAQSGGDASALADRVSDVLQAVGGASVVVFGPAGRSVIIAVFGHAWADVTTNYGEQRLALRESSAGVRSVLPGTLLAIRAGIGDVNTEEMPQRWGNLESGTVHGRGLLFVAGAGQVGLAAGAAEEPDEPRTAQLPAVQVTKAFPAPTPSPRSASLLAVDLPPSGTQAEAAVPELEQPAAAEQPTAAGQITLASPPEMPVVEPAAPSIDRGQPFSSVMLVPGAGDAAPQAEERAPLPIAAAPPKQVPPEVAPAPHPAAEQGVQVLGVYCKNGHFDDPSARYCAICGISMAQLTLIPRPGPRPPLGVLVLDDGSIFSIDTDYVIGRDPFRDQRVTDGAARPMRVDDPKGLISRAHAQIRLDGWQVQVVDLGSANGTGIWAPGESAWRPIPRLTPVTIRPGTQVGFGQRQLRYESHRNT